jgi:hypothetical protein
MLLDLLKSLARSIRRKQRAGDELPIERLTRLKAAHGGAIVCDDYGAATFPGARRAWVRYCALHDVSYVVLDTGQSVILKA